MMKTTRLLKSMLLLCALIVGSNMAWATAYISYLGGEQQASTTISSENVSAGSVGVISWTGTDCTYSESRVNIAANGSITFTAESGCVITKIVIVSGSTSAFYGTWTSSPSVTPTASGGTTTFNGLNANPVTVTTSTAFRCTSASSISIYYEKPYTVTLGDTEEAESEASVGAGITLPNRDVPGGSFYTFEGWSETKLSVETTSATIIKTDATYHPSKDVTLYPVYSRTVAASDIVPASVSIAEYAEKNKWQNGSKYVSVAINSDITATASGSGNTGKFYTAGNNWRFYQSGEGKVIIGAGEGCSLSSVTFTYTVDSDGQLKYSSTVMTSGEAQSVTGNSAEFTVSASSGTTGQVRITAIEVKYAKTYYTSIADEEENKTVTSFGWATFIPAHAVSFEPGSAYVVTDATTTIELSEVTKVPAGTPLILKKATEGNVDATVINENPAAPATNLLSIGGATIPSGKNAWVLAKDGVSAGFKQWTGEASVLEGRVVLLLDEAGAREFISFGDNVTGMAEMKAIKNAEIETFYNLAGLRVTQPVKGLYIVNGKKVIK